MKIFVLVDHRVDIIEYHKQAIKLNVLDEYTYTILDNSIDSGFKSMLKTECLRTSTSLIDIHRKKGEQPEARANGLAQAHKEIFQHIKNELIVVIPLEFILVNPVSFIKKYQEYGIVGLPTIKYAGSLKIESLNDLFLLFNPEKLPEFPTIDFSPTPGRIFKGINDYIIKHRVNIKYAKVGPKVTRKLTNTKILTNTILPYYDPDIQVRIIEDLFLDMGNICPEPDRNLMRSKNKFIHKVISELKNGRKVIPKGKTSASDKIAELRRLRK